MCSIGGKPQGKKERMGEKLGEFLYEAQVIRGLNFPGKKPQDRQPLIFNDRILFRISGLTI